MKYLNLSNKQFFLAKRRPRRDWQSSGAPSAKLRLMEASNKLKKTLHEEETLRATKYIENLSRDLKTNCSLWKATKTIKPPVESEKPLRKPCGAWARNADEKAILFANHLSDVFKPNPTKTVFCPVNILWTV